MTRAGLPAALALLTCASAAPATLASPAPPALEASQAAVGLPDMRVGDSWIVDQTAEKGTNFTQQRVELRLERLDSEAMVVGVRPAGSDKPYEDQMFGRDWSHSHVVGGVETVGERPLAFPMRVGSTWSADFPLLHPHPPVVSAHAHIDFKVTGWQTVTVPAGVFRALRIEGHGAVHFHVAASAVAAIGATGGVSAGQTARQAAHDTDLIKYSEIFYAPAAKRWIKGLDETYNEDNVRVARDTNELASFKPGP